MSESLSSPTVRDAPKRRQPFWQGVRALAILAVLIIHLPPGTPRQFATDGSEWGFHYWMVLRQFVNFPVGIFFFLSGYFIRVSPGETLFGVATRRRLAKLVPPYLIWTVVYTCARMAIAGPPQGVEFLGWLFLGDAAPHLYFIVVLFQLTVLAPWLVRALPTRYGWVVWLITPTYLVVRYVYVATLGEELPLYETWFSAWIIFYTVGIRVRMVHPGGPISRRATTVALAAVLVAVALEVVEAYLVLRLGFPVEFASSQLRFSTLLYVGCLIFLFLSLRGQSTLGTNRWVRHVGDRSYGIYYVHVAWNIAFGWLVATSSAVSGILPLVHVLQGALVLGASLLTIAVTRRILGARRASALLGF